MARTGAAGGTHGVGTGTAQHRISEACTRRHARPTSPDSDAVASPYSQLAVSFLFPVLSFLILKLLFHGHLLLLSLLRSFLGFLFFRRRFFLAEVVFGHSLATNVAPWNFDVSKHDSAFFVLCWLLSQLFLLLVSSTVILTTRPSEIQPLAGITHVTWHGWGPLPAKDQQVHQPTRPQAHQHPCFICSVADSENVSVFLHQRVCFISVSITLLMVT